MRQCLRNYIGTPAFADDSYLMTNVKAKFMYKNVPNTSQNAVIGRISQILDETSYHIANLWAMDGQSDKTDISMQAMTIPLQPDNLCGKKYNMLPISNMDSQMSKS